MISALRCKLKFNREIDKVNDWVCLGGFDMTFVGIGDVSFDFETNLSNVDPDDATLLDGECGTLDIDTYEEAEPLFNSTNPVVESISEFCVYTGENSDLEVVEVLEVSFFDHEGNEFKVSEDVIEAYNENLV